MEITVYIEDQPLDATFMPSQKVLRCGPSRSADLYVPAFGTPDVAFVLQPHQAGSCTLQNLTGAELRLNGQAAPNTARISAGDELTLDVFRIRFSRGGPTSIVTKTMASQQALRPARLHVDDGRTLVLDPEKHTARTPLVVGAAPPTPAIHTLGHHPATRPLVWTSRTAHLGHP